MTASSVPITDPAKRAARVVALGLLRDVLTARDRLDDPSDADALHDFRVALRRLRTWLRAFRPVLRDTLRGKVMRRLGDIADATGASRDLEVRIEWIDRSRRQLRGDERKGASWLIKRLRQEKVEYDAELRRALDDNFDKTTRRVEKALSRYEARVEGEQSYEEVAGEIVSAHLEALDAAMAGVSSIHDRSQAHAARIAAKRLRYVLEIVAPSDSDQARAMVSLKDLQDKLGDLHDAQMFGSQLASLVAEYKAASANNGNSATNGVVSHVDPVAGLQALLERLRRREKESFRLVIPVWHATASGLHLE
ncbi:MAG TPA: CHAD domain-containing protein [Gemmatimonadaceae bacterium]|jgi:CHAD domain-containing protein|nr:CHAD domain-containing protein [Gemmatimonadaceae bacterium]